MTWLASGWLIPAAVFSSRKRQGSRAVLTLFLLILVAVVPKHPRAEEQSPAAHELCSLEAAVPVTVASIDSDFDILLDDGRRLALAGLEFPAATPGALHLRLEVHKQLSARLIGRLAFLDAGSAGPDRWGRIPARLYSSGEGVDALVSLGEALLAAGLARFRPDPAAFACRNGALLAERAAREQRLGLWASADYFVVDASRSEAFLNRKGMIVVEGVISGIGDAGGSIYLNFGPRRGVDFAAVIRKRNLGTFEQAGLSPRMLTGRRVRVRGLIETRFGPRMEIASPAEIELIDGFVAR